MAHLETIPLMYEIYKSINWAPLSVPPFFFVPGYSFILSQCKHAFSLEKKEKKRKKENKRRTPFLRRYRIRNRYDKREA